MNVIRHFAALRLRPALVTTVAAGAGLAGLLGIGGGVAHASVWLRKSAAGPGA
jgi:hypothetical protein